MTAWRLIDPGPLPAWQQMALDAVVIRARAAQKVPDTLRFMEFDPHTVLVGHHQAVDWEVDRAACERLGVEINRRITGGGAIYMDRRQLGWEMCLGRNNPALPSDSHQIYRTLSQVVIEALGRFGIDARFRPVNDVEVNGRKISGTGGVEWGEAMIYQGTLLVEFDVDTMLQVLKLPIEKLTDKEVASFRQRTVTMAELLGAVPPMAEVKASVRSALESVLGITLKPEALSAQEEDEWIKTQDDYRLKSWIDRRRPPEGSYAVHSAAFKAPGGLLRAYLQVDTARRRIRRAFLTGDFFALPDRAPLDLEASLKDCPLDLDAVRNRIRHHLEDGNRYLGVEEDHWVEVIHRALGLASLATQ